MTIFLKKQSFLIIPILILGTFGAAAQSNRLRYGDIVQGHIERDAQEYSFEGRAGDIILIDMITPPNSTLDAQLRLSDSEGGFVAQDDDGGHNTNARIGPLTLSDSGLYTINAGQYAGSGDYLLQLTNTEEIIPLTLDKPLQLTLDNTQPLQYLRLDNREDAILRLEVENEDNTPPPIITLYDSSGSIISSGAYARPGIVDPFIAVPEMLYIIALDMVFPQAGIAETYHVHLLHSEVELMTPDTTLENSITPQTNPVHYFEAFANQRIVIEITRLEGSISPALYIRSVNGEHFLFSSQGEVTNNLHVSLTIPADGLYSIEISDGSYSGESGIYRLHFGLVP